MSGLDPVAIPKVTRFDLMVEMEDGVIVAEDVDLLIRSDTDMLTPAEGTCAPTTR